MDEDKTIIGQLKQLAVLEGFEEDTEPFEKRMRQLKVVRCREMRAVSTCQECKAFDYCELSKQVMREHRGY